MAALTAIGADVSKAETDALAFATLREAARESDDWAAMLTMFDAVVSPTTLSSEHRLHISIQVLQSTASSAAHGRCRLRSRPCIRTSQHHKGPRPSSWNPACTCSPT